MAFGTKGAYHLGYGCPLCAFFWGGDSLILLNDKEVSFVKGENLRNFLLRNAYDPDFLACEVNEKLVKKVDFDEFIMEDESKVEVFSFVGGGWYERWDIKKARFRN